VLERILSDIGDEAPGRTLALGDGPVEIRETHKKGGYTIGVRERRSPKIRAPYGKKKETDRSGGGPRHPRFLQMDNLIPLFLPGESDHSRGAHATRSGAAIRTAHRSRYEIHSYLMQNPRSSSIPHRRSR